MNFCFFHEYFQSIEIHFYEIYNRLFKFPLIFCFCFLLLLMFFFLIRSNHIIISYKFNFFFVFIYFHVFFLCVYVFDSLIGNLWAVFFQCLRSIQTVEKKQYQSFRFFFPLAMELLIYRKRWKETKITCYILHNFFLCIPPFISLELHKSQDEFFILSHFD